MQLLVLLLHGTVSAVRYNEILHMRISCNDMYGIVHLKVWVQVGDSG